MPSTGVVYIDIDGEQVPAWTCGCGEEKDGDRYIVKYDEPEDGVSYGVWHESCMALVEDE